MKVLIFLAIGLLGAFVAQAQPSASNAGAATGYPDKPVRLVIGFPAGSATDIASRILANKMGEFLGQSVLVENRPGASTSIAAVQVAKAAPDGYTLFMAGNSNAVTPSLQKNVPFDFFRDFAPVALGVGVPNILVVHPSVAAKSVQELVTAIKAKQGGFSFASAGNGTSGHLALEQFRLSTGTSFVHVPYKGGGPALQETVAGQVQALFSIALAATPQVKAGKVRALAITSAKRSPVAPELPTVAESGYPGFEVIGWFGWLAPAKTGNPIVDRLNRELVKSLSNTEVKERLLSLATVPVGDRPEEFGSFIRSEYDKWGKVIKAANIQIQ